MRLQDLFLLILTIFVLSAETASAQNIRKVEIFGPAVGNASSGEVAVVQSTGLVYIAGQAFGNNIGVINPNTNSLTKVIRPADLNNSTAIFFSRVNQTTNIVYFLRGSQIDPVEGRASSSTFNELLPALTFANQTVSVFALDPTRSRMYVGMRLNNSNPVRSQVQTIDINPASATFHQILSSVALPAGQSIAHVAVNTATNKVYAATSTTGGGIYVFDGAAQSVSFISGTQPGGPIIVNETSNTIYAGRSNSPSIQAIDGATNTLTTNIVGSGLLLGTFGELVAVNSVTERVYAVLSSGSLAVIDAKRGSPTFNTILANVSGVGASGEVAVDEGLNKIVVASGSNFSTSIIDGATNAIVATAKGNMTSADVTINPVTHRAFVGYTFYTTQSINLNNNSFVNIGTIHEIGEGIVNPTNNFFYFGSSSAVAGIGFLAQNDNPGSVSGLPHSFGRYLFAARNAATNRLYFVNSVANLAGTQSLPTNNFVAVVDGATNSVVANVEVGGQPIGKPAVNEATNKIYIPHAGSGSSFPSKIVVIDGATNNASDINTSAFPANTSFYPLMRANPTTNRIYFQTIGQSSGIGVINGATNVATPLAGLSGGDIQINPTLNRIYLLTASGVRVLSGADDSEIANVAVSSPSSMAINQTTGKIYVRSLTNQTLTVIDPNTNTVIAAAPLPNSNIISTIAINEATNELYLGAITDFNNEATSTILFVNGDTLAVRKTLPVPLRPSQISVNPAAKTLYVTPVNASQRTGVVIISDDTTTTAVGQNVTAQSTSGNASVTFMQVTSGGTTTFTALDSPSAAGTPPPNYTILESGPAFDITTTASYTSPVTVCLTVSSINNSQDFARVRILHGENGQLVDRTILAPDSPAPDFAARRVCARVNSLSPFVAALAPLAPTAANVTVSGRVLTANGSGIRNALVSMVDEQGNSRVVLTGRLGYFRFDEAAAGRTYIISVRARRFSFSQPVQALSVNEDLADVNFVAKEDANALRR